MQENFKLYEIIETTFLLDGKQKKKRIVKKIEDAKQ
jgi:hypothetical protein